MKKLDNFINCLAVLANADFKMAETNDIYRTGIIGQFNLSFELAWKALQEIMRMHGIEEASTGSPREILQLAYKIGFISDSEVWLLMLKKRNTSVHIYNEDEVDEMILLIRDSFIPAFTVLKDTLVKKLDEAESVGIPKGTFERKARDKKPCNVSVRTFFLCRGFKATSFWIIPG